MAAVVLRGPQVASWAVNVQKNPWHKRKHMADMSQHKRSLGTRRNKCGRRDLPEGKGGGARRLADITGGPTVASAPESTG